MSAFDILDRGNGIDVHSLAPLQRILLVNDGTLTEILEAAFLEPIELVKISQNIITAETQHAKIFPGQKNILERKILLRGGKSGRNYAYAESLIALAGLGAAFRDELLASNTPLGRLWLEHRLETFKEMREIRRQPAHDLGRFFACAGDEPLLVRTYHVFSAAKLLMAITEYF